MELSIIIPSRNEMFLKNTVEDALKNIEADTEIIVVLDGKWADPPLVQHERVNVIYTPKSIGQRAATNLGCRLSKAKYVMKLDAHCSFDKGFDRKMIEGFKEVGDNVTMVPIMRNLWAFDWKCCKCGKKWYQGPTPMSCPACDNTPELKGFKRKMMWVGKHNPQSTSYCFDAVPHFQYFEDYKHRPKYIKDNVETGFTETMSLQGSCFMLTRKKYWELDICDESVGSWGNQGIETSLKTRTSGGKVLVNHKTWYAHLFRTQGGDFSFPYPQSGRQVQKTKSKIRDLFWNNKWDKQIYPLSKVIEEFQPIPRWSDEEYKRLKQREMEVKRSGVYSIKNIKSGKVYIGSAINLAQRFGEHLRRLRRKDHENKYLQSAWNKYGEKSFTFNIEYFCEENDLLKHEQRFIDSYKNKIGWRQMYNLNPIAGSNLGRKHTEESLAIMRTKHKGKDNGFYGKKHTEESIQKIREAHKGKIPWNKGIPHTEETKEKISISQMGKEAWNKGLTKETDERIKKFADKLTGKEQLWEHKGMLGKKHNEETKQEIREFMKEKTKERERNKNGQFIRSEEDIIKLDAKRNTTNKQ